MTALRLRSSVSPAPALRLRSSVSQVLLQTKADAALLKALHAGDLPAVQDTLSTSLVHGVRPSSTVCLEVALELTRRRLFQLLIITAQRLGAIDKVLPAAFKLRALQKLFESWKTRVAALKSARMKLAVRMARSVGMDHCSCTPSVGRLLATLRRLPTPTTPAAVSKRRPPPPPPKPTKSSEDSAEDSGDEDSGGEDSDEGYVVTGAAATTSRSGSGAATLASAKPGLEIMARVPCLPSRCAAKAKAQDLPGDVETQALLL